MRSKVKDKTEVEAWFPLMLKNHSNNACLWRYLKPNIIRKPKKSAESK